MSRKLRIAAYVLVGDPRFVGARLRSYYDYVDRIVFSDDRTATSWTGTPLADLRQRDTDRASHHPTTVHEVVALSAASVHYPWVRDHETMRRRFGWSGHAAEYSRAGSAL